MNGPTINWPMMTERRRIAQSMKYLVNLGPIPGYSPVVWLLVRDKSGLWWVDAGIMLRSRADEQRREWNRLGYGCLILKHMLNPGLWILEWSGGRWRVAPDSGIYAGIFLLPGAGTAAGIERHQSTSSDTSAGTDGTAVVKSAQ